MTDTDDTLIPADHFVARAMNAGHKLLHVAVWAGKHYALLRDVDGTIYSEPLEFLNG